MEKGKERSKRQFGRLLFIFSLASCSLLVPRLITTEPYSASTVSENSVNLPPVDENSVDSTGLYGAAEPKRVLFSPAKESSLSCDRSDFSSDVCVLRGDIRASPSLSSIFLYAGDVEKVSAGVEKIRPYTRKWETRMMSRIDELKLVVLNSSGGREHHCDVVHSVPAIVFSTGGYIGNVYHDFRDCIIPLYITASRFNRRVVFLVVNYRSWWKSKYMEILSRLSIYPPIDFFHDNRTHCFPDVTVGLHVHGELAIDPSRTTPANQTIHDFQRLLEDAYRPREVKKKPVTLKRPIVLSKSRRSRRFTLVKQKGPSPAAAPTLVKQKGPSPAAAPTLVIIFRKGSRAVENENEVVELCKKIGFNVQVLRPDSRMQLADIFRVLRSSDAMMGVVGCALTHLLFMRPGTVFIQVLPLGTEWAAEANYGRPAKEIGLKYIPYRINPTESSLSRIYAKDDPVLTDSEAIASKGWDVRKSIFLDKQTLKIDLGRFLESMTTAYQYLVAKREDI